MIRTIAVFALAICSFAQPKDEWRTPFPAHRVIGNVYYVGTYDLACFLIVTPNGNILINTGVDGSVPMIKSSIESLGFKFDDTKILLTTQAHVDHVAGMAEIKRLTGAKLLATDGDAPVLEDGGQSDPLFTKPEFKFAPVQVGGRIKDGQKISLGGTDLTAYSHPGHTRGSASYGLTIAENGRNYRVLIANMGSINPGTLLIGNKKYPQISEDYARTFREQKKLECDIFLSSHASQYRLHDKWKPGQAYNPDTFVDPEGYKAAVNSSETAYQEWLAKEKGTR
ncbi:MAG TPA: subclass B3 metallo-beta-lactamase [Bryobacteraceae bacterium]|jgi:metallo-beta-lactamase class B|nr:subclass B3 metallo-beta-lactamase [Bryobacteraceae bacterium]